MNRDWIKHNGKSPEGVTIYYRTESKIKYYKYRLYMRDGDGKPFDTIRRFDRNRKPFTTLSDLKADYEQLIDEVSKRKAPSDGTPDVHTTQGLWDHYAEHRQGPLSVNTMAKHEANTRNHISKYFGDKKIETITLGEVKNFFYWLQSEGKQYNTIKSIRETMSKLWTYAKEYHIITKDMYDEIFSDGESLATLMGKERNRPEAMDKAQTDRLMEYAKTKETVFYIMVCLTYYGGVRIGEALGLTWGDIDWENNLIRRQLAYDKGGKSTKGYGRNYIDEPKERKERVFRAADQLMDALAAWKEEQAENKRRYGKQYRDNEILYNKITESGARGTNFVLRRENGNYITHSAASHFRERASRDLGEKLDFHAMRKGIVTVLVSNGISLEEASRFIGHADIRTTEMYYLDKTKFDDSRLAEALRRA